MAESDEELVHRSKNGDKKALEALVGRYDKILAQVLTDLLPTTEDAEDIRQEILLSIVVDLPRFREQSAFKTWVYRISRNKIADFYRKFYRNRRAKEASKDAIDSLKRLWKISYVGSQKTLESVYANDLLENLPDVVLQRLYHGKSFQAIADENRISYEAARSRYRRRIRESQHKYAVTV
jgi:RNA polymerase sigma-70 factor (ECF subfamily)